MNNFTEVKPLYYWVQHVLPLVYDDSLSYMELLARVTKRLNELIENNNKLPDYIMELIKEYISSGEIEKVLAEVLANYMLNVKFPPAGLTPAKGDGSADDTEAIQGCIDYAFNNGGMSVYFPSGSYLTQPLTLRNKATLFGQDRYTTRLVMKGGATTAMFTGDVDELTLSGLGFDGNMDIQVNNVNLFTISVNSAIISNCLLTDGYDLLNITVNNDLQLNDLLFRHAVENALVLNGAGIVQGENLIFKSVSTLVGKNFVVMGVSKSILEQVKCYGASPNGVLITGNNNVVKMWNEQSLTAYVDNGTNNSITVYTQLEVEKLTGSKTSIIGGNVTETVTGNKEISAHDITETATGTRTENTTGNRNETTGGNTSESITGDKTVTAKNSIETLTENKIVNAVKSTESLTGDKTVTAANSVETIQGDKTVTAGDISETAENKTVGINKVFHLSAEEVDFIVSKSLTTSSEDFVIDSINPVTYKQPLNLNKQFNYIPFKDINNIEYRVLVDKGITSYFINVKDYGAKGDGETDDTNAFKDSINASIEIGFNTIFVPDGSYKIGNLTIPENIAIIGSGSSIILSSLRYGNAFNLRGDNTLKNLIFDAKIKQAYNLGIYGDNCIIDKCIFYPYGVSIGTYATINNLKVSNCFFDGSKYVETVTSEYTGTWGLFTWQTKTEKANLTNSLIIGNYFKDLQRNAIFSVGSNVNISDNTFYNNHNNNDVIGGGQIDILNQENDSVNGYIVNNNIFESPTVLNYQSGVECDSGNTIITGNILINQGNAIVIQNNKNQVVSNNYADNCGSFFWLKYNLAKNVVICNNTGKNLTLAFRYTDQSVGGYYTISNNIINATKISNFDVVPYALFSNNIPRSLTNVFSRITTGNTINLGNPYDTKIIKIYVESTNDYFIVAITGKNSTVKIIYTTNESLTTDNTGDWFSLYFDSTFLLKNNSSDTFVYGSICEAR